MDVIKGRQKLLGKRPFLTKLPNGCVHCSVLTGGLLYVKNLFVHMKLKDQFNKSLKGLQGQMQKVGQNENRF